MEHLKEIIKECIEETIERNMVKNIIREELRRMYKQGLFEKDNKKEKEVTDTARGQLKSMLDKNPLIKKSQIAYKLHPGVDHDSARHMFQDQIEGEDPLSSKDANIAIDMIHNAGF